MVKQVIGSKGGSGGASFVTKPDSLRSNDSFEILLGLGSGRWKGLTNGLESLKVNGVPMENPDGSSNFQDVFAIFADGNPLEDQIVNFKLGGGGNTQSVNTGLSNPNSGQPGPWVSGAVSTVGANFIDLRFVVQQLFYQDEKSIRENTANIEIQMRPTGGTTWINPFSAPVSNAISYNPDGYNFFDDGESWNSKLYLSRSMFNSSGTGFKASNSLYLPIKGKTNSAFVKELRVSVPNSGTYTNKAWEVRARLIEKDTVDNDDIQERRVILFESVAAVIKEPLGADPEWDGLVWLQLHGKASDQFSGFPTVEGLFDTKICKTPPLSVFNPETRQYTGATWDGSYERHFTRDPAWAIKEFVEDPEHGIAGLYPGATLDKWDALEASKYYSELVPDGNGGTHPRFSMDLTINESKDIDEMMSFLAGSVNSYTEDVGNGTWRLKVDKPETPVMLFTEDNVFGDFQYSHSDVDTRFNDWRGTFLDESLDYQTNTVRVFDQSDIDNHGTKFTEIALVGCTNAQEALRRLMYRLRVSLNEYKVVTFNTNRVGRYLSPLNTILIADGGLNTDELTQSTSRIDSHSGTTVTLKRAVRLETGVNYTIQFSTSDKQVVTRSVTNSSAQRGEVTEILIDSALPTTVLEDSAIALAAPSLPALPLSYRVLSIERVDDSEDQFTVTASIIDAGKWNAMDNVSQADLLAQESSISIDAPTVPVDGMFNVTAYTTNYQFKRVLQVNWNRPGGLFLDGFKVEYRLNNGAWITGAEKLTDSFFELQNPEPALYDFKVTALDRRGVQSTPLIGRFDLDEDALAVAGAHIRGPESSRPADNLYPGLRFTATDQPVTHTDVWNGTEWVPENNLVTKGSDIGVEDGATVGMTPAESSALATLDTEVQTAKGAIDDLFTTYGDTASAAISAAEAASNAQITIDKAQEVFDNATTAINAGNYAAEQAGFSNLAKIASEDARDVAITKAGEAAGSATTSAGHASTANTKADEAAGSASAASGSASVATTKAGEAVVSASNAATSESNAAGSAASASTQAGIAVEAGNAANRIKSLIPTVGFKNGANYWLSGYTQNKTDLNTPGSILDDGATSLVDVPGVGQVLQSTDYSVLTERATRPFVTGQKIRVRIRTRLTADRQHASPHQFCVWVTLHDAAGAHSGYDLGHAFSGLTVADGWVTREVTFEPKLYQHTHAEWRLMVGMNGYPAGDNVVHGEIQQFDYITIDDVTSEVASGASAAASATSASNALASETAAGQFAAASETDRIAAQTAKSGAESARDTAVSSASTATGAASTATTQASLSATARQQAQGYAESQGMTPNGTFDAGEVHWVSSNAYWTSGSAPYGSTWRSNTGLQATLTGPKSPVTQGRKYELQFDWVIHAEIQTTYAGLQCYSADNAVIGNVYMPNVAADRSPAGEFYRRSHIFNYSDFYAGTATVRPIALLNYTQEGLPPVAPTGFTDVREFWMVDVTEREAAATSASASATSASNAAASENAAGQSASAANQSKLDAQTAKGGAEAAQAAAVVSESNAAGSASSAATQAGLSATARGEAQTAADAAALSASNAYASETAAGQQASSATTAANTATTKAGEASSSASSAATSASGAMGSASTATAQANLAATYANPAGLVPNGNLDNGLLRWETNGTWLGQGAPYGSTIRFPSGLSGYAYGPAISVNTDRKYEATVFLWNYVGGQVYYSGLECLDAAGASLGRIYFPSSGGQVVANADYYVLKSTYTGIGHTAPAFAVGTQFVEGTIKVRPVFLANYNSLANGFSDFAGFELHDITERDTATTQAGIATTQAATATAAAGTATSARDLAVQYRDAAEGHAGTASTQAGIATSERAIATSAAAAAQASAVLSASVSGGTLNPNPTFVGLPTTPNGLPSGWSHWASASSAYGDTVSYGIPSNSQGYYWIQNGSLGVDSGFATASLKSCTAGLHVLEADFWFADGYPSGAGVYVQWHDATGAQISASPIPLDQLKDATGNTLLTLGTSVYRVMRTRTLVTAPAGTTQFYLIGMTNWSGFGVTMNQKAIFWERLGLRPATESEITTNTALPALEASVSTHTGAIAAIEGSAAFLETVVAANGSNPAMMQLKAGKNGAKIGLVADVISLGNNINGIVKDVLRVENGQAKIDGGVLRNAKVAPRSDSQILMDIELAPLILSGKHGDTIQYESGASFGAAPMRIEPVLEDLPALAAGEKWLISTAKTATSFVPSVQKIVAGTITPVTSSASYAVGGVPSRVVDKAGAEMAYNSRYKYQISITSNVSSYVSEGVTYYNHAASGSLYAWVGGSLTVVGTYDTSWDTVGAVGSTARTINVLVEIPAGVPARSPAFGAHAGVGGVSNLLVTWETQSSGSPVTVNDTIRWKVYAPPRT